MNVHQILTLASIIEVLVRRTGMGSVQMRDNFVKLDYRQTPLGEMIRRWRFAALDNLKVYEVKPGEF